MIGRETTAAGASHSTSSYWPRNCVLACGERAKSDISSIADWGGDAIDQAGRRARGADQFPHDADRRIDCASLEARRQRHRGPPLRSCATGMASKINFASSDMALPEQLIDIESFGVSGNARAAGVAAPLGAPGETITAIKILPALGLEVL